MGTNHIRHAIFGSAAIMAVATVAPAYAQIKRFDVPAQPAANGVEALAHQADVQILISARDARGKRTNAVKGAMPVEDALRILLRDTGLDVRATGERTYTLLSSPLAQATQQLKSEAADDPRPQDIIVTGTRIVGNDTFESPQPVTSVTASEIKDLAPGTVADGLRMLPVLGENFGTGQKGIGNPNSAGQNYLSVRSLGTGRTLTLVNGRRFVPSGPDLRVDSNLIPSGLLDRADVVAGGASAAYGSDAVGGVINLVTNTRLTGMSLGIDYGQSEHGDNQTWSVSAAAGLKYGDGRGHFVMGGESFRAEGVPGDARASRVRALGQCRDPNNTAYLLLCPDIRTPYTAGGLFMGGVGGANTAAFNNLYKGTQFGSGGAPIPYDYGTLATDFGITASNGSQSGGDGFREATQQAIRRPLDRHSLYLYNEYEFGRAFTLFGQFAYGSTQSTVSDLVNKATFTISRPNPYLIRHAPAMAQQMTTLGITSIVLDRLIDERGRPQSTNQNRVWQALIGGKGHIANDWTWEAGFQTGRSVQNFTSVNQLRTDRFALARNAVVAAAGNLAGVAAGTIVCADTVSTNATARAAAAGCAPFDPFGYGSPSDAALNYVLGTGSSHAVTKQTAADFNLSGKLLDLPAGPLKVAVGGEWRALSANTTADAASQATLFSGINQRNFAGKYDVREVYGEISAPLLADVAIGGLSIIRSLDLNLAGRHSNYSVSGSVNSWKIGLNWQVNNDIRIRYMRSQDIRGPNLIELFDAGRTTTGAIGVDDLTGKTFSSVPITKLGNPNLRPEIGKYLNLGLVMTPSGLPGFRFALDAYKLKITDSIGDPSASEELQLCNLSKQTDPVCAFFIRDPVTRDIIAVNQRTINRNYLKLQGVDFEAQYRVRLDQLFGGDSGMLVLRTLWNYRDSQTSRTSVTSPTISEFAGTVSNPKWRWTTTVNYMIDKFGAFLSARYIGSQILSTTRTVGVNTDYNHIKPAVYVDGRLSWSFDRTKQIYLRAQNLLNRSPNFSPLGTLIPTNPGLYDEVGRNWTIGASFKF